jgi:hypothetical protein
VFEFGIDGMGVLVLPDSRLGRAEGNCVRCLCAVACAQVVAERRKRESRSAIGAAPAVVKRKSFIRISSVSEALIGGIGDSHYGRGAYAWLERRVCWDTYATLLGKMAYLGNADGGRLE